jgi:hypothetical protein
MGVGVCLTAARGAAQIGPFFGYLNDSSTDAREMHVEIETRLSLGQYEDYLQDIDGRKRGRKWSGLFNFESWVGLPLRVYFCLVLTS